MFQVTEEAVDALKTIRESGPYEEGADARIQLVSEGQQQGVGLSFEDSPKEGDSQVAETGGMKVFLASELVEPLKTAVLDVQETGGGKELTLREQGHDQADGSHEGHDHG